MNIGRGPRPCPSHVYKHFKSVGLYAYEYITAVRHLSNDSNADESADYDTRSPVNTRCLNYTRGRVPTTVPHQAQLLVNGQKRNRTNEFMP